MEHIMRVLHSSALILALTIASLLGVACQSDQAGQTTPSAPAATAGPAAAGGATAAATGPREIPTPSPDKAVIHGVVLDIDSKKPLSDEINGVDLFLAQVIHSPDGLSMSSLDKTTAPRADPGKDGVFVFADVAPGEYAVVVRSPFSEVVGRSSADLNKDVVVTVSAGQTLDLGQVYTKFQ
jgi:hypothetical protein